MTVVFLAFNRREELRLSLEKTLGELDYEPGRLDVIVVDNASTDGTVEMLASDFPDVQVVARSENCGVSGFNDGFERARGDWVLALDDDCYVPPDGLRRAVREARSAGAHLVSFGVESAADPTYRFDLEECLTGLLSFWGCAVLVRRDAVTELRGYDRRIFVWANELEFMLRFFDRGYRHLHLPEVVAVHAKPPGPWRAGGFLVYPYRVNTHNLAYVAGKLLAPRDAAGTLLALFVRGVWHGTRSDRGAYLSILDAAKGFLRGLRRRQPVRAEVSRTFRHNYEQLASPWWMLGRDRAEWLADRAALFPERRGVLEI